MIKNDRQLKAAKEKLEELNHDLKIFEKEKTKYSDLEFELGVNAYTNLIINLKEDIDSYYDLINNSFHCFRELSIEDLPKLLVSSRICQGLTHKNLAEIIGLHEQQIQRYETNDYEGASLARLLEVTEALNLDLKFQTITILGKNPDFQKPKGISDDDISLIENSVKSNKSLFLA